MPYYPYFAVAAWTGMRCGEISALTWSDIDFAGEWIHVRRNVSVVTSGGGKESRYLIGTPKTEKAVRDVPLHPEAEKALRMQKELQASGIMPRTMSLQGHNDYVFISRRSRPFIGASAAYYIRKYIAHYNEKEQRAALEEHREMKLLKPFGIHAFRRYFISAPQQSCGLLIGVKNFERYVRVAGFAKLHQQFPKLMKFIEDNGISVNDIRGEDADVKKPYVHRRHKKQIFRPHLPVALFYMFIGDKKLVFSAEPAGKGDKAFIYGPVFPVLLYDLFYRGVQLVGGLHFEQPV